MKVHIFSYTCDPLKTDPKSEVVQRFMSNVNRELNTKGATVTWLQSSGTDFDALRVTFTAVVITQDEQAFR